MDDRRGAARIFHVLVVVGRLLLRYRRRRRRRGRGRMRADMLKAKDTRAHPRHTRGYAATAVLVYILMRGNDVCKRDQRIRLCIMQLSADSLGIAQRKRTSSRARRLMIIVAPRARPRLLIYNLIVKREVIFESRREEHTVTRKYLCSSYQIYYRIFYFYSEFDWMY